MLIESLGHRDAEVRYYSTWAFGDIGGDAENQALGDALKDWDDDARYGAASSLGRLGGDQAVTHLITAMYDYDESVRRCAANVLGEIGDVRAVPALVYGLKHRGGWRKVREDIVTALGRLSGPEAMEGLIYALRDDFPSVGSFAARCLGRIGGEEAYQGLIDALPDLHGRACESAAQALIKIGDLAAGPATDENAASVAYKRAPRRADSVQAKGQ